MITIVWDNEYHPVRDCEAQLKAFSTILTGKYINQGGENYTCHTSNIIYLIELLDAVYDLDIPETDIRIIDLEKNSYTLEQFKKLPVYSLISIRGEQNE